MAPEGGRVARGEHLVAAHAHDHEVVHQDRRPEHHRLGVVADRGLPQRFTPVAVEGHDPGVERAHDDPLVVDGDRAADVMALEVVSPALVAGLGVEGPQVARPVAEVDHAVCHRGRAGHALDPAQLPHRLQIAHRLGPDGRLVERGARVGQVAPQPQPLGRFLAGLGPVGRLVARAGHDGPAGHREQDREDHAQPSATWARGSSRDSHAVAAVPLGPHAGHGSGLWARYCDLPPFPGPPRGAATGLA
jgi:hypothetical protein